VQIKTYATYTKHQTQSDDGTDGGVYSEVKMPADARVIKIEKGYWSNAKQDWHARLCFDNGAIVNSQYWYSDDDLLGKVLQ
jgi:hypothetical protein